MRSGPTWLRAGVLGQIPGELLAGDLSATCDNEWSSRMVRWALHPVTKTAAAEHVLVAGMLAPPPSAATTSAATTTDERVYEGGSCRCEGRACMCTRCLVVLKRGSPPVPLCVVEAEGRSVGRVSLLEALH
jgi:hypothetical protein